MPNMLLSLISIIVTMCISRAHGQETTCDPPTIANGLYTPNEIKYRLEDVITYHCDNGFYPSSRGNKTRCTDGGWAPPPRCSVKPCELPEIKHGVLYEEEKYRPYFPVAVGQWYYYSCDDNYVPSRQVYWGTITCTPNGWSPDVPCLRKCVVNNLEHGRSPRNGETYLQGETANLLCHPGYSHQSQHSIITCTENGWSSPLSCLKKPWSLSVGGNSELVSPSHVTARGTNAVLSPAFSTRGGVRTSTRNFINEYGGLSKFIEHCDMPLFENATAIITGKVFRPNDTLDYQCLDGYETRDGNTKGSMVCGEEGWSHLPSCFKSAEKCGPPPGVSNGNITSFPLAAYPPGSRVEYQCEAYYELRGPNYVTCSDAKWSKPPKCLDPCVICEEILNKNNIQLKGKENKTYYAKTGEIIEFTCKSGHSMVTSGQSLQAVCREGIVKFPRCE